MNIRATKTVYNKLVKSGELLDMFPTMTGIWESDKDDFMLMYNQNDELDLDMMNFDEDFDEFNEYDY